MDTNGLKPTVISTFCGTGGSSLGYHWAGFKELLAIDFDAHAVECFKANFPDVPVWHKSVVDITAKEIMEFCGIQRGKLDVLDGSPPCQGFSTSGLRKVSDPRNDLFKHYCRLIQEIEPKVFVMENVSGMIKGSMKGKFIEIMKTLKGGNYNVKCKLMNAMYYGVPQSRERLIFIGVRKDLNLMPVFPIPSNKMITVKQALQNVVSIDMAPVALGQKEVFSQIVQGKSAVQCVSKEVLKKYIPRMVNNKNFSFIGMSKRLRPNHPSPTITKTYIPYAEPPIHPYEDRIISIQEVLAICSFPINWKMDGQFKDKWARLGNAVMPKFMQAIATTIKTELLGYPHA